MSETQTDIKAKRTKAARLKRSSELRTHRRLSFLVSIDSGVPTALERLAAYHGLNKQGIVERLVLEADKAIRDGLAAEELGGYYLTDDVGNQEDEAEKPTPKKRGRPKLYSSATERKRAH